jgi:flagellar FliL protein
MAKEKVDTPVGQEKKNGVNMKVLLIGIPIFVVQLVAVYFVTANFLLDRWKQNPTQSTSDNSGEENIDVEHTSNTTDSNSGKFVYLEEDIIVNPAQTEGKRLLLTSVGFDLLSEENVLEMRERKIPIRDLIITTIANKTIEQLNGVEYRDSLKLEIANKVKELIPGLRVNQIYFAKYIIQ